MEENTETKISLLQEYGKEADETIKFLRENVQLLQDHCKLMKTEIVEKDDRISELIKIRDERFVKLTDQLQKYRTGYTYYKLLQESILENENVMNEWQRFLAVCRLSFDDPVPGLTEG